MLNKMVIVPGCGKKSGCLSERVVPVARERVRIFKSNHFVLRRTTSLRSEKINSVVDSRFGACPLFLIGWGKGLLYW